MCKGCGTREEEWGEWADTPEGRKFLPFDDPPYEAHATRCHGCRPLERERDRWAKAPDFERQGIHFILRRSNGR